MADSASSNEIYWVDPTHRGILPLDGFHISRSLRRAIRKSDYTIKINSDFKRTVANCANRDETWINGEIFDLYSHLHNNGFAHSLEVWRETTMIGGLYGVALGGAFFGESMFSTATNGSKIALAYLIRRLNDAGFSLCDTQFITPHLQSLGAIEIPREAYHEKLAKALKIKASFTSPQTPPAGALP